MTLPNGVVTGNIANPFELTRLCIEHQRLRQKQEKEQQEKEQQKQQQGQPQRQLPLHFFGNGIPLDSLPYARDVTLPLQLIIDKYHTSFDPDYDDPHYYNLMAGKSLNSFFGDPSPGVTKKLHVIYKQESIQGTSRLTCGENEALVIRVRQASRVIETVRVKNHNNKNNIENNETKSESPSKHPTLQDDLQISKKGPTFHPYIHELVLPFLLPYLPLGTRVWHLSLVCKSFLDVIRRCGATDRIDVNDGGAWAGRDVSDSNLDRTGNGRIEDSRAGANSARSGFYSNATGGGEEEGGTQALQRASPTPVESSYRFSPKFLKGAIKNSVASLVVLMLSGYEELNWTTFLNPLLPKFERIRFIDLSYCGKIEDDTLVLIGRHLSKSLEVLYLKGLSKVTDVGITAIATACTKLTVLEVSNVRITDSSAIAIGQNLRMLEALYMRDNYLLTDVGVAAITEGCPNISQLTLWGCIKLTTTSFTSLSNLVLLNLWGCHYLQDDHLNMSALVSLRTLIVAECHKLGDDFIHSLVEQIPNINHLNLRYLRKLTDDSMHLIAQRMKTLYTLDLSFCSKLTADGIGSLLIDVPGLSELRLFGCSQLQPEGIASLWAEPLLWETNCLSILDLRSCLPIDSLPFLTSPEYGFNEFVPNLFLRDAKWNDVQRSLHEKMVRMDGGLLLNKFSNSPSLNFNSFSNLSSAMSYGSSSGFLITGGGGEVMPEISLENNLDDGDPDNTDAIEF
ncbi:hypothetical protein TrST_g9043 [Triparma strigata]|uniref:F-box/LRR-repeat protein 15-like leucin rich repeat domain-containing protein n=1 Tax=Triparma strigata TaxID=1606541 RepID=A0A9W6ZP03_9STRA|nr:hypothetical protein TrST_g9043 [Triparma strigata]